MKLTMEEVEWAKKKGCGIMYKFGLIHLMPLGKPLCGTVSNFTPALIDIDLEYNAEQNFCRRCIPIIKKRFKAAQK